MRICINNKDKKWNRYVSIIERAANAAAVFAHVDAEAEVSITLTDDKSIKKLNKEYRGKNSPTNVLSFELGDDILLGDIFISMDTVAREAASAGISIDDHLAHMVVHGILHLNGYDHIDDADARIMEKLEVKALKKLKIKNPYSESLFCACPGDGLSRAAQRLIPRANGAMQYVLLFVLGAVASLGFAPFNNWLSTVLGIGTAYLLLSRDDVRGGNFWRRFLRASPFGAGYGIAMFWWTLHSIYVVPELTAQFAVWTIPGVIGLMLAGAIIFGLPFTVITKSPRNNAHSAILFAATWTLILWLREWFLTGFPWNPIANITLSHPWISNSMSMWGALGLTFVIMGLIASLCEIINAPRKKGLYGLCGMFVLLMIFGAICGRQNIIQSNYMDTTTPKIIRIIQPARSQSDKMALGYMDAMRQAMDNVVFMRKLSTAPNSAGLVIFPETAYPFTLMPGEATGLGTVLHTDIITGATTFDGKQFYNSMAVEDMDGNTIAMYNKSHLVPFGEYKPLGFLPAPTNLGAGDGATVINAGGISFVPAICYEIIFTDSLVPRGATVDAIINITNDTWFGKTPGVYQHLDMVRRYAIESGLPVVRANYSGVSAFISASGDIVSALPVGVAGKLDGFVWGAHTTPYRIIGRDNMMIIILATAIGLKLIFVRRK